MFEVKPMRVEQDSGARPGGGSGTERSLKPLQLEALETGCETLFLYDSQDWALSPSCSPEEPSTISPMLAEETLRYMTFLALEPSFSHTDSHSLSQVLSGDRVEKMTKAYSDIDMVTNLLAERDRDLELAARIGQTLLQRNHVLQERQEEVEEQLVQALDRVHQLQHELAKKDELLRMVASASEESESDSSCSTPLRTGHTTAAPPALSQLEALQSKLQELEEENMVLRSEACLLKTETVTYEEKEQQLVSDCVKELRESSSQMVTLTDELSHKNEELLHHQEEIAQLLSQIVELQQRVKQLALEKEELRIHLEASKDAQRQLTGELNELQDRNAECVGMLHESQEEVRELRYKSAASAGARRHLPYAPFPMDSLAAEIEGTMRRVRSAEDESILRDQRNSQRRVFQTVRSCNESGRAQLFPHPIPGSAHSGVVMTAQPFHSGMSATQTGSSTEEPAGGANSEPTEPDSPDVNELASALHRLSLRRGTFLCRVLQAERGRQRRAPGRARSGDEGDASGSSSPSLSVLSSAANLSEFSATSCFKTFLPEKLQIVKPMEGSLTLHHWQQLAQPHLATILDPHPGVVTKGFRPLPQDAVYRLSDLEEDEDVEALRARGGQERQRGEEKVVGGDEDEEEEGGIIFRVRCASTPEEKKAQKSEDRAVPSPVRVQPAQPPDCSPGPPVPTTSSFPSSPLHPKSQALGLMAPASATYNPGKCVGSTFSTYTFTTCRILHPCDVTQVTSSCAGGPALSTGKNVPSSLRSGPSTPVTPCRLSLDSSFPPRRAGDLRPRGLAKILLEKGISAQLASEDNAPLHVTSPEPPRSAPLPPPALFDTPATGSSDSFLASRPAELFLQDVYGLRPARSGVGLVERLRRLGLASVLQGEGAGEQGIRKHDSATLLAANRGTLLDGLRRNQSLPAMVGRRSSSGSGPMQPTKTPPHPTSLALPITPWGSLKEFGVPHKRFSAGLTDHLSASKS